MKIAWFTPFDKKSAIGSVSKTICEEIQRQGYAVDIFMQAGQDQIETSVNVIPYTQESISHEIMGKYDHVLYNMGNYGPWHEKIWEIMQRFPGKIVLHDRFMSGFFMHICRMTNEKMGLSNFEALLSEVYGLEAAQKVARELYNCSNLDENVLHIMKAYTMLPILFRNATGVFTHSQEFCNEIRDQYFGSIDYAYLPYCPQQDDDNDYLPKWCDDPEKLLVVSNGIVQPLKRTHIVAEVLMENPEIARHINFVVIGGYDGDYGKMLKRLAENELQGSLHMIGYQPYHIMHSFLKKADIAINLRYPNSEVGSLSLFEQMAYENATIVLDSGIYGEIPENTVARIHKSKEKEELKQILLSLIKYPSRRKEIAQNAKKFILEKCTAEHYVNRLVDFLGRAEKDKGSYEIVNRCLRKANEKLSELEFESDSLPNTICRIEEQYSLLFNAEGIENNVIEAGMGS